MKSILKEIFIASIVFISIVLLINCNKPESPDPDREYNITKYHPKSIKFEASIQGVVLNINGAPIQNAKIESNGLTTYTDENGIFNFPLARFTGDFCYIKASKNGFFTGSNTVHGKEGNKYQTNIIMQPYGVPVVFDSRYDRPINLAGGASILFYANSFVDSDGKQYNGKAKVYVEHINPSDPKFPLNIPGGDLRGFNQNGNDVSLYSFGMLNVEIRSEDGNLLQIAEGKVSKLIFPIPPNMKANAPNTIPLWYFDEELGVWIEEGEATLIGGKYVGKVSHFTPYNVDIPAPNIQFNASLEDCNGKPVKYGRLRVGQLAFMADKDGNISGNAIASITGTLTVDYYDDINDNFIGLNKQISLTGTNNQVNLGKIKVPCRSVASGNVNNCDGSPFNGYAILKSDQTKRLILITDGVFFAEVPSNGEAATLAFFKPSSGQLHIENITLPNSISENIDIGEVTICNEGVTEFEPKFSFLYTVDNLTGEFIIEDFEVHKAYYDIEKNETIIKFKSKNQDSAEIVFRGKETSFFNTIGPESEDNPKIYIYSKAKGLNIFESDVSLNVSQYSIKDKWVSGTFDGFFEFPSTPNVLAKPVYITSGIFSAELEE